MNSLSASRYVSVNVTSQKLHLQKTMRSSVGRNGERFTVVMNLFNCENVAVELDHFSRVDSPKIDFAFFESY